MKGTAKVTNQPQRAQEALGERSQFKWPRQRPLIPAYQTAVQLESPEVDFSQPAETQSWQPMEPVQEQQKRGKRERAPLFARRKKRKPRRKKLRRLLVIVSIMTIIGMLLCSQSNGALGAQI